MYMTYMHLSSKKVKCNFADSVAEFQLGKKYECSMEYRRRKIILSAAY